MFFLQTDPILITNQKQPSIYYALEFSEIKKFHVNSNIQIRYAITDVETEMQNFYSDTREALFDMFIPKEAFVSKFIMVINGKSYEAKVKTKEVARNVFTSSGVISGKVQSIAPPEFINGKYVSNSLNFCPLWISI